MTSPTKIICLTQAITEAELRDDQEYEDILQDMRIEGRKFGDLANVVIPRPNRDVGGGGGVGKVFFEYADIDGAAKARAGINGHLQSSNKSDYEIKF
ncbi:Splicing factor U2af large subunit B [Linum perenne]